MQAQPADELTIVERSLVQDLIFILLAWAIPSENFLHSIRAIAEVAQALDYVAKSRVEDALQTILLEEEQRGSSSISAV